MSVLKVIEVLAESNISWEDAAKKAVAEAAVTLHGIKSVYVENMNAKVENNKLVSYRANIKITFRIDRESNIVF